MSVISAPLTTADLLAMPDDGIRRRIYKGELIEEGPHNPESLRAGVTLRNRFQAIVLSNLAGELNGWRWRAPAPNGCVVIGEAGVQFAVKVQTALGVDVAYVPPDVMIRQTDDNTVIVGVPTLIVEILSPSTTQQALNDRLDLFDEMAVPVVWIVDTHRQTVTVYRHGQPPALVNRTQDLDGSPERRPASASPSPGSSSDGGHSEFHRDRVPRRHPREPGRRAVPARFRGLAGRELRPSQPIHPPAARVVTGRAGPRPAVRRRARVEQAPEGASSGVACRRRTGAGTHP